MPRVRPTPDAAEIVYRFLVPLPVRVSDRDGLTVEFIIRDSFNSWYLSMGRVGHLGHVAVVRCPTREEVEEICRAGITVYYPGAFVYWFKRLRLRGDMELVMGPHTRLAWTE